MNRRRVTFILLAAFLATVVVLAAARARRVADDTRASCAVGFTRVGARCCAGESACAADVGSAPASCPSPLVPSPRGCDAPDPSIVAVPETSLTIGPSDWEAEGRVGARTIKTAPFRIDRFEVSVGRACARGLFASRPMCTENDAARAAFAIALADARAFCRERGGRLPTEDEWIAVAAGERVRRYPWGDTGAVCRRAAWGLAGGPCGDGARGPDTVGAHPDGVTPVTGVHDLAGNVAEWVETGACAEAGCVGVVRGGSWSSALATDLRTWQRREVPARAADPTVGLRCAYDAAP